MEGFAACTVAGAGGRLLPGLPNPSRHLSCRRPRSVRVRASRDGPPELDKWDQMEIQFGRLLGEDPNLTLAKILARKANPDISYLDVEKSFMKNKGKLDGYMINTPPYKNVERQSSVSLNRPSLSNQKAENMLNEGKLNLSRPSMNKEIKARRPHGKPSMIDTQPDQLVGSIKSEGQLSLSRPSNSEEIKARRPAGKPTVIETQSTLLPQATDKGLDSNITLRKPSVSQADDIDLERNPKLKIRQNLILKMRKCSIEEFSDVALLKRPEMMGTSLNPGLDSQTLNDDVKILDSTETAYDNVEMNNSALDIELQPPKQSGVVPHDSDDSRTSMDQNSVKAALLGKPMRMDASVEDISLPTATETISFNDESHDYAADVDNSIPEDQEEREDNDWKRAEQLLHTGERDEVELISCSGRGFAVSFGSLIGFLPYRNLSAKWKFLAFESWLRRKGLDPSMYRQNLSVLGGFDAQTKNLPLDSNKTQETDQKYEDLLKTYDQEKTKFLSSFVGQRILVSVVLADRNSRRLLFSGRRKEKEELVEKKRSLMAKLRVGDIVKCCVKKVTYFGIFVEVEGVPALIHQSEVSWDATLDPSSFYKIDQIIEAKVHQLDYTLDRIALSLREITPDPLMEALESVVGDSTSMGGSLEAVQADVEWADVDSLIKELQQIDGVQSVSKGRFFLSPGLAPTFQVYMASMFENQYKLLARFENKVQEVLVQASLDKEQMKATILTCTNRVV